MIVKADVGSAPCRRVFGNRPQRRDCILMDVTSWRGFHLFSACLSGYTRSMELTKIGRYEIKAELGRGGMATVYRAYDPSFDREVAVKVLPREFLHNPQFHERFQREIKTIAKLEHPAIVPVYDVGVDEGIPYFVMRYMTGGSLSDWIEKGRFSLEDTARIIERVGQALSYAHRKGLIHRDLKPDNILFDSNGDPFISDFGIAKFAEGTSLTGSGIIGTPAYMSPEQATGDQLDNRSDVYGLGVIVYQMLSGKQPYNSDTPMGVAIKHVTEPVPEILKVNPDLPESADAIIKTAMAKEKEKRYATATELARALNVAAFGTESSVPASSGTFAMIKSAPARNMRLVIAGAGVLVVLLGVFLLRSALFGGANATGTPSPTRELATVTEALPSATVLAFAPSCQIPTEEIPVPVVKETTKDCINKIPYTTLSIPLGATYEPQAADFECSKVGVKGDTDLIACTGKQLFSFDLKVCTPSNLPALDVTSGKCSQDAGYDEANRCCMPLPAEDAGCTIFKVDIGGCS